MTTTEIATEQMSGNHRLFNRFAVHATETDAGPLLPAGVFHLLAADRDVTTTYRGYVVVCGEPLVASGLPPACWFDEVGPCPDARYCLACVHEAGRWGAAAGVFGE
jgi:hypothetical protein